MDLCSASVYRYTCYAFICVKCFENSRFSTELEIFFFFLIKRLQTLLTTRSLRISYNYYLVINHSFSGKMANINGKKSASKCAKSLIKERVKIHENSKLKARGKLENTRP